MIRGTTPTHIFRLPVDTSTIREIRITYCQFGRTVMEKTEKDVTMDGDIVQFTLTQEESLLFRAGSNKVQLQVKVLTTANTVLASPVKAMSVEEILNEEVLK